MRQDLVEKFRNHFQNPEEAAHACIRDGRLLRLQSLLSGSDSSPNPYLSHDHHEVGSPLHFAAQFGELDAVELLLAAGADPLHFSPARGWSRSIVGATRNGHRDVAKRLLRCASPEDQIKSVRIGKTNRSGLRVPTNLLCLAAERGHARIVEDLLSWNDWPWGQKNEALHLAASDWHFETVALLLESDTFGNKQFHSVLDTVVDERSFLGPGPTSRNIEGFNYFNLQRLIELMIDKAAADPSIDVFCSGERPLVWKAASNANLTVALKTFLEKGADPNATAWCGGTALHILARPVPVGRESVERQIINEVGIKLMLQHGASVTLRNKSGDSPIQLAAYGSNARSFRLFLTDSTHPGEDEATLLASQNSDKETLLHYAAAGCRVDIIDHLVSRGLDVNAKSSQGWTPLMCAMVPIYIRHEIYGVPYVIKTSLEVTQAALCLLAHGAEPQVVTDEGWTPLHALALHCDVDVHGRVAELATQLIARGVNPEARAPLLTPLVAAEPRHLDMPWGHRLGDTMLNLSAHKIFIQPNLTPLQWAAQRGALGVVKALVAAGVDHTIMDASGLSPIDMAQESKTMALRTEAADAIVDLLRGAGAYVDD